MMIINWIIDAWFNLKYSHTIYNQRAVEKIDVCNNKIYKLKLKIIIK